MNPLICPRCSAAMELALFAPGDKIARCPYCGAVIDLDDPSPGGEEVTEYEEETIGKDSVTRKKVRVVKRSVTISGDASGGMPDVDSLLASAAIPEEVRAMMRDMVDGVAESPMRVSAESPEKPSLWRRLFGPRS